MFIKLSSILFCLIILVADLSAQQKNTAFKVIPLGVKGGDDESNLSAYLLAPTGSDHYISLDAGTLNFGIQKAIKNKVFKGVSEEIQKKLIKGYLISHAHLDHIAGLIINSPADTNKNIYAMPKVINILKDKYFTWDAWANFANEGEKPLLNKYSYIALAENKIIQLPETEMNVQAFYLSHGNPYQSTAFLVGAGDRYVLYLGDTGADQIEKSDNLQHLWREIAPLVNTKKLKAIFMEVSFPNKQPNNQLFGHLTPKLFFQELDNLKNLTNEDDFKNLTFIVTHIKPPVNNETEVKRELKLANKQNLKLIFPKQGRPFTIN